MLGLLALVGPIMNLAGLVFLFFAVRRIARFLNVVEANAVLMNEHLEKIAKRGVPLKPPRTPKEDEQ